MRYLGRHNEPVAGSDAGAARVLVTYDDIGTAVKARHFDPQGREFEVKDDD